MSLPQAHKDVSDHPAKGTVVAPVDKAEQAADVDRKLRFYGVIQAFRESRMPSNAQIDAALKYALDNSPVDVSALSPDGQKLIQDSLREVVAFVGRSTAILLAFVPTYRACAVAPSAVPLWEEAGRGVL